MLVLPYSAAVLIPSTDNVSCVYDRPGVIIRAGRIQPAVVADGAAIDSPFFFVLQLVHICQNIKFMTLSMIRIIFG